MSWRTLLILGGTGSGHVAFAESLLAEAEVRRLAADRRAGDLAGLAGALVPVQIALLARPFLGLPRARGALQRASEQRRPNSQGPRSFLSRANALSHGP